MERRTMDEHVGVRELRQNLSVYLRRIQDGEEFTVTDRGVPVASLGPLKAPGVLERLIEQGLAEPARVPGGFDDWMTPLPPLNDGPSLSERIIQAREEERF